MPQLGARSWSNAITQESTSGANWAVKGNRHTHRKQVADPGRTDQTGKEERNLDQPAVVTAGHMDTGAKITASTISRIHKLLKSAFAKAMAWEYTAINPTIGATLPEYHSAKRAVWPDDEALQALAACDNPVLRVCLYAGAGMQHETGRNPRLAMVECPFIRNPPKNNRFSVDWHPELDSNQRPTA